MTQKQTQKENLEKLIKSSLFLDKSRKKKLLENFSHLTSEEQNKLQVLLQKEKKVLKESLKKYLRIKGKEGFAELTAILTKGKSGFSKHTEEKERKSEGEMSEDILDQINNL